MVSLAMLNTVINGTKTIEEFKEVKERIESLTDNIIRTINQLGKTGRTDNLLKYGGI